MQHNNFITESEMENIANLSRSLSACHVTQLSTLFNICSKYLFDQWTSILCSVTPANYFLVMTLPGSWV